MQAQEDTRSSFYESAEAMEALQEAQQLLKDPTAKRYRDIDALFADCFEGDDFDVGER